MAAQRLIIDTDPGIDDAMAIFYALSSPELEVLGLTTVFGNAHVELCTTNALRLLDLAGRPEIPVVQGAGRPLAMPRRRSADFVHGDDGQGNVFLPPSPRQATPGTAAQFIVDTVLANPGEVTVVLLGPFTNMALAMLLSPGITSKVRQIVVMGGSAFADGNVTPAAEANVYNDPEAADLVFSAECPIVMAGLDVTHATTMTTADLARYSTMEHAPGRHLAAILPFYADFYRQRLGVDGIFVHDSATITFLLHPELFEWRELPIRVDCADGVCRGKTLAAHRHADEEGPWAGRRPVRILTSIDGRVAVDAEINRIARWPGPGPVTT